MAGHDTHDTHADHDAHGHDAHGHDDHGAAAQEQGGGFPGKGLITGLGVTLKHFIKYFTSHDAVTEQYPDVMPNLPPGSHGTFKLDIGKCIACGLCQNACPNHVIKVTSEKDENNKKKLSGYKMMTERCLFCGLCVEACPAKALAWSPEFEHACYEREDCNIDFFKNYVPPVVDKAAAKPADANSPDAVQ